jgi:heme-degrading monooxygenase HmoA
MYARVARYEVDPARTREAVEAFRDAAGQLAELPGLTAAYVLADDEDGVVMTMTFWANRAAMDNSEVKASGLRHEAAKSVDGEVVSVHCLEVTTEIGSAVSTT